MIYVKKTVSVLLAVFLFVFCAMPIFAAKSVEFSASDSEVFAGDEFTVDIFISDYSLLKSASLLVEYDKNSMEFLDLNVGAIVTAGSKAVSYKDVKDSGKSYVQIDYNDSSASLSSAGKFLSLTFVASDTAFGETDVKITAVGNKITLESGSVTPNFKNGKINIIKNDPNANLNSSKPQDETSSSAAPDSETSSETKSSSQNISETSSENSNAGSDKNEENRKTHFAVVAVAVTVIVICAVLFGSIGNGGGKKRKKKRKKRKSK